MALTKSARRRAPTEETSVLVKKVDPRERKLYLDPDMDAELVRICEIYGRKWNAVTREMIRLGLAAHYRMNPDDHPDAAPRAPVKTTKKK